MELIFRAVLTVLALILTAIIFIITRKYRALLVARKKKISKEEVIGKLFLRKLKKIDDVSDREPSRDLFMDLNTLMRNFFSELYDIAYEFAYVELNEELVKKGVDEAKRKEIIDYTMEMEKSEYSGHPMTNQEFYYLLGKSIHVIRSVTGYQEDYALKRVPEREEAPPVEEKPPEKPVEAEKKDAKKEAPETEKKEERRAPVKGPAAPKPDARIDKIRTLIIKADNSLREKKPERAMESYARLNELYGTLEPEQKMRIHEETRNIIRIYNELLREYKDLLTPK